MIHRRLVITGRVQNVFYRDWLKEQAEALAIDGWVRNRADGLAEVAVSEADGTILDGFEKRSTA